MGLVLIYQLHKNPALGVMGHLLADIPQYFAHPYKADSQEQRRANLDEEVETIEPSVVHKKRGDNCPVKNEDGHKCDLYYPVKLGFLLVLCSEDESTLHTRVGSFS